MQFLSSLLILSARVAFPLLLKHSTLALSAKYALKGVIADT